jgi:hypothetical protein
LETGALDLARDVAGLEFAFILSELPLEEAGIGLGTVLLVGRLLALVSNNLLKGLLVSLIAADSVLMHFIFVDKVWGVVVVKAREDEDEVLRADALLLAGIGFVVERILVDEAFGDLLNCCKVNSLVTEALLLVVALSSAICAVTALLVETLALVTFPVVLVAMEPVG